VLAKREAARESEAKQKQNGLQVRNSEKPREVARRLAMAR
ncbi:hypothetical protein A2U01_0057311, partial [Trifolium medium]|nr:hypothetical protein [Trifolium medium]